MTILKKYKVSWFHELSFNQLCEVLSAAERYADWNRLGFLCALVESQRLTITETVALRDAFKAKYTRYYRHRAFTHIQKVAFLEYLDVADRPENIAFDRYGRRIIREPWQDLFAINALRLSNTEGLTFRPVTEADYFIEDAYQRGISGVRKGAFRSHPQHRTRTVLSDPYEAYFGEVTEAPFEKTNAHELKTKYSYNKRNGSKYKPQKQPDYPEYYPHSRSTKNHKRLYQRLGNKRRRAAGKLLTNC